MIAITTPAPDALAERDRALARSLLYEALALGLRPPTARTIERLARPEAAGAVADAAAVIDAGPGAAADAGLAPLARRLATAADAGWLADVAEEHRRLFGHTARSRVPAYETEYGEDTLLQKPQEMSDIAGFFRAFGLRLDPSRHERIDHISCELEFLAFLARKEAFAVESGDEEMLAATRRAMRLFLIDHLGRFAPSFAHRVRRESAGGFYARLADLCLAFVRAESVRLQAPIGPDNLRLRLPVADTAPLACGGAEGCAPGPCGPGDDERA